MNKKLEKLIKKSNRLIEAPYNKFNLKNYQKKIFRAFKNPIHFINTNKNNPIKLMGNQDINAGIITSNAEPNKKRNIYIVGKGILFDAGGYDLKPSGRMNNMKIDCAGMIIAFAVASYFNRNDIIAYCPVSVNLIPNGIIPGDYLKIGRKEVEVTNTDAEGRLVLVEALSTLKPKKDDIVITVATLTGACAYALGEKATAFMTPTKEFTHAYKKASKKAGELAWRLPLWDYLQKDFNKKRIINASKKKCGTIMGGMFIKQFIKYPKNWIHLDIASSAFDEKKNKATGEPIKTIVEFIKRLK